MSTFELESKYSISGHIGMPKKRSYKLQTIFNLSEIATFFLSKLYFTRNINKYLN